MAQEHLVKGLMEVIAHTDPLAIQLVAAVVHQKLGGTHRLTLSLVMVEMALSGRHHQQLITLAVVVVVHMKHIPQDQAVLAAVETDLRLDQARQERSIPAVAEVDLLGFLAQAAEAVTAS